MPTREVIIYVTEDGWCPYSDWLQSLRDEVGALRIRTRIARAAAGNLGDHKSLGGGVFEFRMHFGPGYRVYFAQEGDLLLILLCGGDKDTQDRDIQLARGFRDDWLSRRERSDEE